MNLNAPQSEFLDLYRAGLRNAVDLMKTSLQNAEQVRKEQLSAIRNALEQNARSLAELERAQTLDELLALQQKLAGSQFERVMDYWGDLCRGPGQGQVAVIGRQMAQAREWFNESYALASRGAEEAGKLPSAPR